jgi:two-component system cell cycle sensor histidine kinase/response regulator CckA
MPGRLSSAYSRLARASGFRRSADPEVPLRVLVVDDEESVRNFVSRVLREAGCSTTMASDGIEAIQAASNESFDLLLTDLMMPHMNGDEVARRLRAREPDLPVLYLTGYSDRLFAERMTLWESEAFLDKPCSVTGLLEAVSLITGRGDVSRRRPSTQLASVLNGV